MKRLIPILVTLAVLLGSAGESFAGTQCEGSPTEDKSVWGQWHNCEGIVSQSDGLTHEGEFRNGLPNGQGPFIDLGGNRIVGEWRDGEPWNTTVYKPNGFKSGEYKNGVFTFQ